MISKPPPVCEHGHNVTEVSPSIISKLKATAKYNGCCNVGFTVPLGVDKSNLLKWIETPIPKVKPDVNAPTTRVEPGRKPSRFYECNHSEHQPFPFQVEGMEFAKKAQYRCGIFDEQGLGKTIQSIVPLFHDDEELMPYLIICKSSLLYQYKQEIVDWCGFQYRPHVIRSSKHLPPTFAAGHIVSYHLAKNIPFEYWQKIKPRYLILDECQTIKNTDAAVTKLVQELVARLRIPHIIATSGTPIKNRPSEFWSILNILKPERFPSFSSFKKRFCIFETTESGQSKEVGMKNIPQFDDLTKDFTIRRERREVYKELPQVNRTFPVVEFGTKEQELYSKALAQFKDVYEDYQKGTATRINCIAALTAMRVIAGWAKVIPVYDKVIEILESNPTKKVAIAGNFRDARKALKEHIEKSGHKTLSIEGGMIPETREKNKLLFNKENEFRVIFLSTLAAGEGLNLQNQCYTVIFMDREWNAANEEQVESRFTRIGSSKMNGSIDAIYMLINAPIDKELTGMVEQKRRTCKEVLNKGMSVTMDEDFCDALMSKIFNS